MKRQQLNELRVEARRAVRLAQRKQRRIMRETGVTSLGKHAPRMATPELIDRYTAKQLTALIERTESFRSRKTQFVALGGERGERQLVTRQRWRQFDKLQKARQAQKQSAFDAIKDITIETLGGVTVGERREQIRPPKARQMRADFNFVDDPRTPEQVTTPVALDKLEKKLKEMLKGSEQKRAHKQGMASITEADGIMRDGGYGHIQEQISELSTEQFYIFWSIADAPQLFFEVYESLKYLQSDDVSASKNDLFQRTAGTAATKLQGLIDVAKQVEDTGRRF